MSTATEYLTLEDYHADTRHQTSTMVRTFIMQGPVVYHETFITKRMPRKDKKEFMLGTASHTLLLEPERFEATVKLIPADKLASNGARSGNKYKDFCAEYSGCILLKADEYDQVRWMAESVFREARALIDAAGDIEQTIHWTDPQTGLACKCRPDKLCGRVLADLKTCANIEDDAFFKQCGNLRYDCQLAHYADGIEHGRGHRPDAIFIVAIEKTPPYRTKVCKLQPHDLEEGYGDNHRALADIDRRMKSGDWREHEAGHIFTITIPPWAKKRAY